MPTILHNIQWNEQDDLLHTLLQSTDEITQHPLDQGFEAEVIKLSCAQGDLVLKIWNQQAKPDVEAQYQLLQFLLAKGIAVSKPMGWGVLHNEDQVLLTTFDGTALTKMNKKKIVQTTKLLSAIHHVEITESEYTLLPKYDFVDYFFPDVATYPDISDILYQVMPMITLEQNRVIHGDFHLGNILNKQDRYTVIDWTNGQLGDARYDVVWSMTLQKIYISERYAEVFRDAYLAEHPIAEKELQLFEALACLRWILLARQGGITVQLQAQQNIKQVIAHNPFLAERNCEV